MHQNSPMTDFGNKSRPTLARIISRTKYDRDKLNISAERGGQ